MSVQQNYTLRAYFHVYHFSMSFQSGFIALFFLYSYSQHNYKTLTYNDFKTQQQFFHCRPLCLRAHWVLLSQSGAKKHARSWTTIITNAGRASRNTSTQNGNRMHCKGPSLFSNIINLDQWFLAFFQLDPDYVMKYDLLYTFVSVMTYFILITW